MLDSGLTLLRWRRLIDVIGRCSVSSFPETKKAPRLQREALIAGAVFAALASEVTEPIGGTATKSVISVYLPIAEHSSSE